MLFSILIPTYNNESSIADAISSALEQVYDSEYEVIVSNNASTDGTLEIINSFHDTRLKVISNEQTVHMYENHNILLNYAKGDYVLFCHADDKLQPNALHLLAQRLKEREFPSKYILTGRSMYGDMAYVARMNGTSMPVNTPISGQCAKDIFLHIALSPSGTCYSRIEMLKLGGFPIVQGTVSNDWLFELIAAFNNWEFELMDRLYFIRTYASTMSKLTGDSYWATWNCAAQWFYTNSSPEVRYELENIFNAETLPLWHSVFQTKERRMTKQMAKYKRNPLRIRRLVKWFCIKYDLM